MGLKRLMVLEQHLLLTFQSVKKLKDDIIKCYNNGWHDLWWATYMHSMNKANGWRKYVGTIAVPKRTSDVFVAAAANIVNVSIYVWFIWIIISWLAVLDSSQKYQEYSRRRTWTHYKKYYSTVIIVIIYQYY